MRDRAPKPRTSDTTIARTSRRGTLMCRRSAVAAASRESARPDQRRKNCRCPNTAISNRAGVLQTRLDPPLCFLPPLAIDWLKSFRFAQDLGRLHRGHRKFIVRKITPARAKIRAGIAQDVDQLQAHPVTLRHREHLVFTSRGKLSQVTKAKPGPKFSRAAGDEIGVFVELSRRF